MFSQADDTAEEAAAELPSLATEIGCDIGAMCVVRVYDNRELDVPGAV